MIENLMTAAIKAYKDGDYAKGLSIRDLLLDAQPTDPALIDDIDLLAAMCCLERGMAGAMRTVLALAKEPEPVRHPFALQLVQAISEAPGNVPERFDLMAYAGGLISPALVADRAQYHSLQGDMYKNRWGEHYFALEHYGAADMLFQRAGDFAGELRNKLKLIRTTLVIGEAAFTASLFLEAEALAMRVDDEDLREQLSNLSLLHAA